MEAAAPANTNPSRRREKRSLAHLPRRLLQSPAPRERSNQLRAHRHRAELRAPQVSRSSKRPRPPFPQRPRGARRVWLGQTRLHWRPLRVQRPHPLQRSGRESAAGGPGDRCATSVGMRWVASRLRWSNIAGGTWNACDGSTTMQETAPGRKPETERCKRKCVAMRVRSWSNRARERNPLREGSTGRARICGIGVSAWKARLRRV